MTPPNLPVSVDATTTAAPRVFRVSGLTLVGLFLLLVGVGLAGVAVWESVHYGRPVDPWKMIPGGLVSLMGANFISSIVAHGFTDNVKDLAAVVPRGAGALLSAGAAVLGRQGNQPVVVVQDPKPATLAPTPVAPVAIPAHAVDGADIPGEGD